jgi:hypothetical protein
MRSSRTFVTPLFIVGVLLVAGTPSALGATEVSKSGKVGVWTLRDTNASPAAECDYDASVPGNMGNDIDVIDARTPRIRARNRSAQRDAQWVGLKVLFQRSVNEGGSGGWVTAEATPLVKKLAHDDTSVGFGRKSWEVDTDTDYHFRVLSKLTWYKPGSKTRVQGRVQVLTDKYLKILGANEDVEDDRCLPEF